MFNTGCITQYIDKANTYEMKRFGFVINPDGHSRYELSTVEIKGKTYFCTEQYAGRIVIGPEVPVEASSTNESSR